ncbi:MAG: type II secretion system protein [Planctomycetes bacterium]|nr:type II secretion system protein [Planctomycetota bacterium]
MYHRRNGFTLVEILIVVMILGILAALVVPQFAHASGTAIKSALQRQLQEVDSQIEIYRGANAGQFPTADATAPMGAGLTNNGWGILVSAKYLKEEPMNPFVGKTLLVVGDGAAAAAEPQTSANGWYYSIDSGNTRLDVFASGYDRGADALSNE